MMTTQKAGFYGSEIETVYVDSTGQPWLVQSPDLVGYRAKYMQLAEVPYQCEALSESLLDDDLRATADEIEAGLETDLAGRVFNA